MLNAAAPGPEKAAPKASGQTLLCPSATLSGGSQVTASRSLSAPRGTHLLSGVQDSVAKGGNNNSGESRNDLGMDSRMAMGLSEVSQHNVNTENRSLAVVPTGSTALTGGVVVGKSLSHDVMAYTKKLDMVRGAESVPVYEWLRKHYLCSKC